MKFIEKLKKLNYYDKIDIISFIFMFGGVIASMWIGGEMMSLGGFSFSLFVSFFFAIPLGCYFVRLLFVGFAHIVMSLLVIAKSKNVEENAEEENE